MQLQLQRLQEEVQGLMVVWTTLSPSHHQSKQSPAFFVETMAVLRPHCDHGCSLPDTVQEPSMMNICRQRIHYLFQKRRVGTLDNGLNIQCGHSSSYQLFCYSMCDLGIVLIFCPAFPLNIMKEHIHLNSLSTENISEYGTLYYMLLLLTHKPFFSV